MKLGQLEEARALAERREELLGLIERGAMVTIIGGSHLTRALAAARQAVKDELGRMVREVERDLELLGVEVG